MRLHNRFNQAQPQPESPLRPALIAPIEPEPYLIAFLRWNTDSVVAKDCHRDVLFTTHTN